MVPGVGVGGHVECLSSFPPYATEAQSKAFEETEPEVGGGGTLMSESTRTREWG